MHQPLSPVPYEPFWPCETDVKGNVSLMLSETFMTWGAYFLAHAVSPFQWSALSTCFRVPGRSLTHAAAGTVPMKAVTTQLQSAAAAGHSTAVATLATVTAAMQATWDPERGKKVGVACMPVLREQLVGSTPWALLAGICTSAWCSCCTEQVCCTLGGTAEAVARTALQGRTALTQRTRGWAC